MAITAGNYIIRSALDEDLVLLTTGGSSARGAVITAGALTEADNRCYWKASVVSTSYNRFYNIKTGSGNGNIMAASVTDGRTITQNAYKVATGAWLATASGNTMTVNGQSVATYFLTAYGNSSLYLTVPDNGGDLYLTTALDDTAAQEFYFEPSTYVNTKLATPSNLTTSEGLTYLIKAGSVAMFPRWNSSKTDIIYEMRHRMRTYDTSGDASDWGSWTNWAMITAVKQSAGIMQSQSYIQTLTVDNSYCPQVDIQVEVRLTSAKNASAYNTTGSVTHGPAVSGIISQWMTPTLTLSAAVCTQYGLRISYASDYTIAGNTLAFTSIMDGAEELVSNYILTNQDYQGDLVIPWDSLSMIPSENDSLVIEALIVESNGVVSATASATLTVTYDSAVGFAFTPTYTLTDRMTIEAKLPAYDSIECYIRTTDLKGNDVWTAVDEVESDDSSYRIFEIIHPFGTAPTVMWVVSHTSSNVTQWGYLRTTLSDAYIVSTKSYVWNWVDDDGVPQCYVMKYRAGQIVQPADNITLPATKYVTTGREYPIFRYSKSIDRALDIEGAILNRETDPYATRTDAELLATANHAVYRQPNGKWYQVGLKTIAFTRNMSYDAIQISQEAETR